ncbi:hypothetical protein YC2023_057133 [Brassica napus]
MDEPSTGLDPASRMNLWTVINRAKTNTAIILTTLQENLASIDLSRSHPKTKATTHEVKRTHHLPLLRLPQEPENKRLNGTRQQRNQVRDETTTQTLKAQQRAFVLHRIYEIIAEDRTPTIDPLSPT